MKVIGLTGGIACGKSTVSSLLQNIDHHDHDDVDEVVVIDADKIAHEALEPGTKPYRDIVDHFVNKKGHTQILKKSHDDDNSGGGDDDDGDSDGAAAIDRDELGKIVFADPSERKVLNSITHKWVFRQILAKLWSEWSIWDWLPSFASIGGKARKDKIVILDVPLLFETKFFAKLCSKIIVVSVEPEELQLERLLKRNKQLSREQALQRIRAQMPLHEKRARADYVIDNSGTLEDLERQVKDVLKQVRQSSSVWRRPTMFEWLSLAGFLSLTTAAVAAAIPIGMTIMSKL